MAYAVDQRRKEALRHVSDSQNNFLKWFKQPIECLSLNPDAGFAVLMVSLPLLERFLREKSGVHEGDLNDQFYDQFRTLFPSLPTRDSAKEFWHVYRNGLLHQGTFSRRNRKGEIMPRAALSGDSPEILYDSAAGIFYVHPTIFARKVLLTIEADFRIFEGTGSPHHPLPVVDFPPGGSQANTGVPFTSPPTGVYKP